MNPPDPLHDEILTVEEVATLLKVHENTVYEKVEAGEIPHFRIGENEKAPIRFSKKAILAWLTQQSNRSLA